MNKSKILQTVLEVLTSTKGIGLIIFTFTLIALSGLLSSRYFLHQNIIENGISKKTIIATKTFKIVDIEKTEKRKHEIVKKVEPILTPAQDDYIKNNLLRVLTSTSIIRKSTDPFEQKIKDLRSVFDITDISSINNKTLNYLLKTSDSNYERISETSKRVLSELLEEGISEADIDNKFNSRLNSKIGTSFSKQQFQAIFLIEKNIIVPNMIVDELATEIAKRNARNSVKPTFTTFKKGEKVVTAGEIVTQVQKDALRKAGYSISELNIKGIIGILLLISISLALIAYYFINFESKYLIPSYLSLISLLTISVALCAVFLPVNIPVYIIPFAALAILLTIFTNSRVAMIISVLTIVMIGIALQYKIEAITVFIVGAMISTFATSKINYTRRLDLIKTGFEISLTQVLIILGVYLLESSFNEINLGTMGIDATLAFISGVISGIIALGTLPLIESAFKIVTPYGLAEFADHNQTLLKRLQFEAPGTYHHSLMVSNLSEAAAEAVGGSPILARIGAFYHDIGKLKRPLFFIENQSYFGIENPHEKLNPRLSKMVITAHPKDGVELAKEYGLPSVVHQFILQHHGDSLASYFYNQALKEEGAGNITEEQFRYTGPKPNSKEAAILMLADAVESAVRSLKAPSQEEIETMIDKIIQDRLIDGQLSDSPITLKDLKTIAATFNRILRGMQHHRIKYHENVLEELENKTRGKLHIANGQKLPKDTIKELKKKQSNG